MIFGLNINFNILDKGPIIPYVSLGFCGVINGESPYIDIDLSQYLEGHGQAKYLLMGNYEEAGSVSPNFGMGAKLF